MARIIFMVIKRKGPQQQKGFLKDLKFDNDTLDAVVHLVRWHDYRFTLTPNGIRKAAAKIGKEYMKLLFEVNYADTSGKNPKNNKEKFKQLEEAKRLYKEMIAKNECVSLKELKISGKDLIAAGFKPGRKMGLILNSITRCCN